MNLYGYGGWISPFPPAKLKTPFIHCVNGVFLLSVQSLILEIIKAGGSNPRENTIAPTFLQSSVCIKQKPMTASTKANGTNWLKWISGSFFMLEFCT
jgi:hypothetical protein